jgi:hypothetical protein
VIAIIIVYYKDHLITNHIGAIEPPNATLNRSSFSESVSVSSLLHSYSTSITEFGLSGTTPTCTLIREREIADNVDFQAESWTEARTRAEGNVFDLVTLSQSVAKHCARGTQVERLKYREPVAPKLLRSSRATLTTMRGCFYG